MLTLGVLVGLVTTGVANHCMREVNDDFVTELNDCNKAMRKIQEETSQLCEITEAEFQGWYDELYQQKEDVYQSTICRFTEVMEQLSGVEFVCARNRQDSDEWNRDVDLSYSDNSRKHDKKWARPSTAILTSLLLSPPAQKVVFVGNMIRGVNLQYKIEAAKKEMENFKEKCESILRNCSRVEKLTRRLEDAYSTIENLATLTDIAIEEVDEIITFSGKIYHHYSINEKEKVRHMYDLATLLEQLCYESIVDADGELATCFCNYINEANKIIQKSYM